MYTYHWLYFCILHRFVSGDDCGSLVRVQEYSMADGGQFSFISLIIPLFDDVTDAAVSLPSLVPLLAAHSALVHSTSTSTTTGRQVEFVHVFWYSRCCIVASSFGPLTRHNRYTS
jgi:hypothetical protein